MTIHYAIEVPVYTLMPDHAHFLLAGTEGASNQLHAMGYFRKVSTLLLRHEGLAWQKQAYDHVLTLEERRRDAFVKVAHYVIQNACRKRLVEVPEAWPYTSSLIPGYPDRSWRDPGFWEFYWQREARNRRRREAVG